MPPSRCDGTAPPTLVTQPRDSRRGVGYALTRVQTPRFHAAHRRSAHSAWLLVSILRQFRPAARFSVRLPGSAASDRHRRPKSGPPRNSTVPRAWAEAYPGCRRKDQTWTRRRELLAGAGPHSAWRLRPRQRGTIGGGTDVCIFTAGDSGTVTRVRGPTCHVADGSWRPSVRCWPVDERLAAADSG